MALVVSSCIIGRQAGCMIGRQAGCIIGRQAGCIIGRQAGCIIGRQAGCMIGRQAGCIIGRQAGCIIGCPLYTPATTLMVTLPTATHLVLISFLSTMCRKPFSGSNTLKNRYSTVLPVL